MANRNFASGGKIYSMHVSPVMVDCQITIGASGAVSSFSGNLVSSVVRSSTGLYQIILQDPYSSVIAVVGAMVSPVSGNSGIASIEAANAPSANISLLSSPNLSIKTLDVANAVANPASGSIVSVLMYLSNSQVKAGTSV